MMAYNRLVILIDMFKVKFTQNFESDEQIYNRLLKMTPDCSGVWKNLKVVLDDSYDFLVIMNKPKNENYDKSKTIVLECETKSTRNQFNLFYKDCKDDFYYVYNTEQHHNADLWYMDITWNELFLFNCNKFGSLSIINSGLNDLPGHKLRNNFISYLSHFVQFDYYGRFSNRPLNNKLDGLKNYRYHFNCENDFEDNYFTEKLLDGIFCECLVFYYGCTNITNFIDDRAFINLDLTDFEKSKDIIKDCVTSDHSLYYKMFPYIMEEKRRIMNDFHPLEIVRKLIK